MSPRLGDKVASALEGVEGFGGGAGDSKNKGIMDPLLLTIHQWKSGWRLETSLKCMGDRVRPPPQKL